MLPEIVLLTFAALLLLVVWRSHDRLQRSIAPRPRPPRLRLYPSVTVIRPVRGLDAGARENIQSAFDTGYPGPVETLFVFDDESEPALPIVREEIRALKRRGAERHGDTARVILCGHPPRGRTGKLHAMITALRHAGGELVAFADSDIRPDRLALRRLVETLLGAPAAGSAFAPVVSVLPPRTAGDAGYALLLNGLYGAAAAAATRRSGGELPFIMGQFMVFKREALQAIGGLESADGQLVDDMYLGARVRAAGFRNMVSPHAVPIIQEGLTLGEFVGVYRRWLTFSRTGLPGWSFKLASALHGAVFWGGLLAAAAALIQGQWLAAFLNALAPCAVASSINSLHSTLGGAPIRGRHRLVSAGLLLGAPLVFLTIFMRWRVSWRGRTYRLDSGSRLAVGSRTRGEGLAASPSSRPAT